MPQPATPRYSQEKKLIVDGCPGKFADLPNKNERESQKSRIEKRRDNKRSGADRKQAESLSAIGIRKKIWGPAPTPVIREWD
jgi:hypothetical protein